MDTTCRVLFCCTGVGIFNRGIESFFREAYDWVRIAHGMQTWLLKGAGEPKSDEFRVPCIPGAPRRLLLPWDAQFDAMVMWLNNSAAFRSLRRRSANSGRMSFSTATPTSVISSFAGAV